VGQFVGYVFKLLREENVAKNLRSTGRLRMQIC